MSTAYPPGPPQPGLPPPPSPPPWQPAPPPAWPQGYWQPPPPPPPPRRRASRLGVYIVGLVVVAVLAVIVIDIITPPPEQPRCPTTDPACKPRPPQPGGSTPPPDSTTPTPGEVTPQPGEVTPPPTIQPLGQPYIAGDHWQSPDQTWGFWYFPDRWQPIATRGSASASFDEGIAKVEAHLDIFGAPASTTTVDAMMQTLAQHAATFYEAVGEDPVSEPNERVLRPNIGFVPAQARVLRGTTSEGGASTTVAIANIVASDGNIVVGFQLVVESPEQLYSDEPCSQPAGTFHCPTVYRVAGTIADEILTRFEWPTQ